MAGNTGGNCGGADIGSVNPTVASGGRNLIGADATGACGQDFTLSGGSGDKVGTQSAAIDAKLGTLGNYGGHTQTIPLLPGSPAIDAGACPAGVTTDQRGIARPQGASCDSGAFESRGVQSLAVAVAAGGPASLKVGETAQYVATGTFDGGGTADISAPGHLVVGYARDHRGGCDRQGDGGGAGRREHRRAERDGAGERGGDGGAADPHGRAARPGARQPTRRGGAAGCDAGAATGAGRAGRAGHRRRRQPGPGRLRPRPPQPAPPSR